MVKKADGTWRPCGDYRRLNLVTQPDKYPVPNIQDLSSRLHGCRIFSKLDLRKGYYQIPMAAKDIPKTAVITPFGLFEFLRMPFGLKNAGQRFQRLIDRVLAGLDFVFVYLDDVIVGSATEEEHLQHLRLVFDRLQKFGLVLNTDKCQFGVQQVEFLGHSITADGAAPLFKHVQAVKDFQRPVDARQLQRFLGLVNFYRRFIPGVAGILKPLSDALRGGAKPALHWTSAMGAAFEAAKTAVCEATQLDHPDPHAEVNLVVDASDTHIGAVLQQRTAAGWKPLSFFSRKLSPTEARYSAFDRELWAIFSGIRHYRYLLEGRSFHVLTDHKPLTTALHRVSEPWSAKQQRQLAYIAEFTADIRHIPGKQNVVADTLSRPLAAATRPASLSRVLEASPSAPTPGTGPTGAETRAGLHTIIRPGPQPPASATLGCHGGARPLDYGQMAAAQAECTSCKSVQAGPSSLIFQEFDLGRGKLSCDVSTGTVRLLVPLNYRLQVFQAFHDIAHPGIRATRRLLAARFVWPRMAADVAAWCRQCIGCARGKIDKTVKAPVHSMPLPARHFAHLHVDIVGPLPMFTMIDRSTRWVEVVPLAATSAADCAAAVAKEWVARFGVPDAVTSDRGAQFTSTFWATFCGLLGIQHHPTTAYHPQANGMVERFHRQLKNSLRARLCGPNWVDHLPWVLLGLRAAPKEDSGVSSAEMLYGSPLSLPGQFLASAEPPPEQFLIQLQEMAAGFVLPPTRAPPPGPEVPPALLGAKFVYIRRGAAV
jgi:hypothetical protein